MKKVLIILIVMMACSVEGGAELQPEMFKSKVDAGAIVIDVRTPEEYSTGHIAGSQNIDIKDPDFMKKLDALDKTKPYAVYCASGVRSGRASDIMWENGFSNIVILSGGIKAWKEKGLPLE